MSVAKKPSTAGVFRHPLLSTFVGMLLCANSHADWSVTELMQLMAQQKSGKASFVEKKYIGFLEKPLESSGELSFDAPSRLEKRTFKPRPETVSLDGDKLTITLPEKRPIHLRLQEHPEVASVVESIRGTLSGDKVALERDYAVIVAGEQSKWQLTLTPIQKGVAKIVRKILISGAEANIQTISFDQADGDRFEMTISKVVTP